MDHATAILVAWRLDPQVAQSVSMRQASQDAGCDQSS